MAITILRIFTLLIAMAFTSSSFISIISASPVTDYLLKNGLPIGLLPSSISIYSLQPNGSFQVVLDSACYATFQNLVYYQKVISGRISYGRIDNLSGIQAQEYFVWVGVTSIHVDVPSSGYIYFSVGFINKRLAVSMFASPPACTPGAVALIRKELPEQERFVESI